MKALFTPFTLETGLVSAAAAICLVAMTVAWQRMQEFEREVERLTTRPAPDSKKPIVLPIPDWKKEGE